MFVSLFVFTLTNCTENNISPTCLVQESPHFKSDALLCSPQKTAKVLCQQHMADEPKVVSQVHRHHVDSGEAEKGMGSYCLVGIECPISVAS